MKQHVRVLDSGSLRPWEVSGPPPLYTADSVKPVGQIRFDWTSWLRGDSDYPASLPAAIDSCTRHWRGDGLTVDHWETAGDRIQVLFSCATTVSPRFCTQRAKGRLQHALREEGTPVTFRRSLALRSLGHNTRAVVSEYVRQQAERSDYIDPRFREFLRDFVIEGPTSTLFGPTRTGHGRYWYNLHVVIVVDDRRHPMTRRQTFARVRGAAVAVTQRHGYCLGRVAVMPDHVHIALRGCVDTSPMDTGLSYLEGLAWAVGNQRCWSREFYVGTFSEYDVRAILPSG